MSFPEHRLAWANDLGFYINLPVGAVASVLLLLIKIPDLLSKSGTNKPTRFGILSKLDLIGFFFFASFAIMFLMALEWGGTKYPWKSATIIGLFCGAGVTLALFVGWEYRVGDEAMIPLSMVRKRVVWSSCAVIGFSFGSLVIFSYYLPIYFQSVKGIAPALSGVYVLPGILSQMVMAVVSGVLGKHSFLSSHTLQLTMRPVGKMGYYVLWAAASAAIVAVSAGLISTFTTHTATVTWVLFQLLGGIGRGGGMQMVSLFFHKFPCLLKG